MNRSLLLASTASVAARARQSAGRPCPTIAVLAAAILLLVPTQLRAETAVAEPRTLALQPCKVADVEEPLLCGRHIVPENRAKPLGRKIPLKVVVVPARSKAAAEPVFVLAGGPGEAASDWAVDYVGVPLRETHDIVLLDLRGTGGSNRLDCRLKGSDEDLQGYMLPAFSQLSRLAACRNDLEARADLTQYTTAASMQDLDDVRRALGYRKINLDGSSYGTRAALIYMQMFGDNVRSAFLSGLNPVGNHNPIGLASNAQRAFDLTIAACAAQTACRAAFPNPKQDLDLVLTRLRAGAAPVWIRHPVTGAPTAVRLTASAFSEGLRMMLYQTELSRNVPRLLRLAAKGHLEPFAEAWLKSNRALRETLALGLYLSVTCSEDTRFIRRDQIAAHTKGTFLGDERLRNQMAVCAGWPAANVPASYFRPFRSNIPVVLFSGALDPVAPPRSGEEFRTSFPSSVHLIHPGAHYEDETCHGILKVQLFGKGSVDGLDTSCVRALRNPPFVVD